MTDFDTTDEQAAFQHVKTQARTENFRLTIHAQQEMVDEDITLDQLLQAFVSGQIIENYPHHRRGACCLISGLTQAGRPLHIVCTTAQPVLIVITTYEPKPPKWRTTTQRGKAS